MVEQGRFAPTEQGTPQGGVLSRLLLNIALRAMEEAKLLITPSKATRRAVHKQAITAQRDLGKPREAVICRLAHTHCWRQQKADLSMGPTCLHANEWTWEPWAR